MPTNQQRREAEKRRLQRQLEQRREREAARKRFTLIASIVGTVVVIAGVVVAIVLSTGGSGKKSTAGGASVTPSSTPTTPAPTTSAPVLTTPTAACAKPGKSATATFQGITVKNAKNLKVAPKVTSKSNATPTTVLCQDLVVGTGKPATSKSTVSIQYTGVLYKDGTLFDSSWSKGGKAVSFSMTSVIPGFTQGIAGAGKVAPMKAGGRRLMILPAALAYGATANGTIPANSVLVFVVDLKTVA